MTHKMQKRLGIGLLGVVVLAYALMVGVSIARSNPPTDYPIDPRMHEWFESQTNPKKNGMSCCKEADGHILRDSAWRQTPNGYQFMTLDGMWHDVPDVAVLDNVPGGNPTGGAVVWYQPQELHADNPHELPSDRIYCFVRPVEG